MLEEIMKFFWLMGRSEQKKRVQQYIDRHKTTGYWLNLREDTFDEEDWVWVGPEEHVFEVPYYVQVIQVDEGKFQVYASREVERDALEYCPCDTYEGIQFALRVMAAGYKTRGEVEVIEALIAPRTD